MARRKTHPGSIDTLKSGSIRIRLSVAGELHTFVLKHVSEKAARAFARKKHEELSRRAGRVAAGLPGQVPFSELVRRFEEQELPGLAPNTRKTYRVSLTFFRRFFVERLKDPVLEEIQAGHVREYLAWRRHTGPGGTGVSNYSLVKDRRLLHRLFVLAERLGSSARGIPWPGCRHRRPTRGIRCSSRRASSIRSSPSSAIIPWLGRPFESTPPASAPSSTMGSGRRGSSM